LKIYNKDLNCIILIRKREWAYQKKAGKPRGCGTKRSEFRKCKKQRGRPKKLEPLTETQMKTLKKRRVQNHKSLNQAIRLRSFFRATFKHTVLGWKSDKSKRLTKDEAEEKLRDLILKLREEGVLEERLEKLLTRCEKYEKMLFTYLKYEGMPPDTTKRRGNSVLSSSSGSVQGV